MKFIVGDIWDYHGRLNSYIGISTNGSVKSNKCCVMGRGVALQAKNRFKGIDYLIGTLIKQFGNRVHLLACEKIFTFPVKHQWMEDGDLDLIDKSCQELKEIMNNEKFKEHTFYCVPPAIGNAKRNWQEIKPILNKYFENDDRLVIVNYEELE